MLGNADVVVTCSVDPALFLYHFCFTSDVWAPLNTPYKYRTCFGLGETPIRFKTSLQD
jgi:hypothetical protein